jgi:hypothetical protein
MFVPFLSLAGLLSGLVTAGLVYPTGKLGWNVLGAPFGAVMAVALAMCGVLRGLWKAILLPVATAAAFYLSFMKAGIVEIKFPWQIWSTGELTPPEPVALFVGGFVGGFLVLGIILILIHAEVGIRTLALKMAIGSLVGGILGVIGWSLGPSLGMVIWSGVRDVGLTAPTESFQNALGESSHRDSLFVVWQTGMALLLAIMLKPYKVKSRGGSSSSLDVNGEHQ